MSTQAEREREDRAAAVFACPMRGNDADALTVGGYLMKLAVAVWHEDEGFSGKRPFGNSGWKYEVYVALAEAGLIANSDFDRDYDTVHADRLIIDAMEFARGEIEESDLDQDYHERLVTYQFEHGVIR